MQSNLRQDEIARLISGTYSWYTAAFFPVYAHKLFAVLGPLKCGGQIVDVQHSLVSLLLPEYEVNLLGLQQCTVARYLRATDLEQLSLVNSHLSSLVRPGDAHAQITGTFSSYH